MAYYHILIEIDGFAPAAVAETALIRERRDITKDEVLFSYVLPYILNETFFVNGYPFPAPQSPKEKRRIWVHSTEETAAVFCDKLEKDNQELRKRGRIQIIHDFSDNINNEIIMEAQMLRYGKVKE